MEGDPTTTAALIALAMSLVKVVEKTIEWVMKRFGEKEKDKEFIVRLDPEASKAIRDIHDGIVKINAVVERYDDDGVPLVYTPRSFDENQREILALMRDVSLSQERLASSVEKLNDTVDDSIEDKKRR